MTFADLRVAMARTGRFLPVEARPFRWALERRLPTPHDCWPAWSMRKWALEHVAWMVQESLTWGPDRESKLNRWLGFVQGCTWVLGLATIEDLRQVNWDTKQESERLMQVARCADALVANLCEFGSAEHSGEYLDALDKALGAVRHLMVVRGGVG